MQDFEVEGLGEAVVRSAGLDHTQLVNAVRLATRVVGPVERMPASNLPGDAYLARVGREWRVYVRCKLPPAHQRFAILHEVAEFVLRREDYREADVELVADRLAACLGAPRAAAVRACREVGPSWTRLASALSSTESCAVLRYGEATGEPLALLTPHQVRVRGDETFVWPAECELRRRRLGPGLRKTRLRDDRARAVISVACDVEGPLLPQLACR